jgi:malate dehydrogenase (quinone)
MKKKSKVSLGILLFLLVAFGLFLYWPIFPRPHQQAENDKPVDAVMIGGGVMSATLATYLQELQPDWKVHLYERMDGVALESSNGWNNAGTGHSAFAELNYTPELEDGTIDVKRAIGIAEQFEVSRQFWSRLVKEGRLSSPSDFINATPHMSFVWGDENIEYLRRRHAALIKNPLFYGMQFSQDQQQIRQWAPLLMEGRDPAQKVAATWMPLGTDVNFGVITNQLIQSLQRNSNFQLHLSHEVRGLQQNEDKTWNVTIFDLKNNKEHTIKSRFVFIGAGGAALKLLQLSGIPESRDYAGFPVGGQFLSFDSPAIAERHDVKAYGMAETGSPPMSVPHLDARKLDGKPVVLFGPFALQSTKFLKEGSWFDLFSSVNDDNIAGMLRVGRENLDLVKYLVQQATLSDDDRHAELLKYFPTAKREDWKLVTAGQRVQVIKRDKEKGAVLQFGTEIVTDKDGTIAALLGASPGASTSPSIMINVMSKAFPSEMENAWKAKLTQMIPSYGRKLNDSVSLTNQIRRYTSSTLHLPYVSVPDNTAAVTPPVPKPEEKPPVEDRINQELQGI